MAARSVLSSALLLLVLAALWAPGRAQEGELPLSPDGPPGGHTGLAAPTLPCPTDCGENARCESGKCICVDDFVNVTGTCNTKASTHLGDPCIHSQQCKKKLGGYSICFDRKCTCSSEGVVANNTCYKKIGLDERCTFPEQCVLVEHSACLPDICLCKAGFVQWQPTNTSICIPVINTFRGECNISLQCNKGSLGEGSACVEKQCRCTNEYYYDSSAGKCLYKKRLDDECNVQNLSGCYLEEDGDDQHIECKKGVCKCKDKYSPSLERNKCVFSASAPQVQLSAAAVLLLFVAFVTK